MVTDRETNKPKYAFVTFSHAQSVPYTIDLMNGLQLYDKPLRLQTRPGSRHNNQGPAPSATMSPMPHGHPLHSDMSRSRSAPDHIQNFANDIYSQNSRMMRMNQLGSGLTNPMAAQSLLSSGNHFPTKEAQRQRMLQQQQQVVQQQQQQQLMQQQRAWLMMQQQVAWNKQQLPHWY